MEFDTIPDRNWFKVHTTDGSTKKLDGCIDGIPYDYDLVRDGGLFYLFVPPGRGGSMNTRKTRKKLRQDRDVVKIYEVPDKWQEVNGKLRWVE